MSKFTSRANDCRAGLWDKVDLVKIKQQFGAMTSEPSAVRITLAGIPMR